MRRLVPSRLLIFFLVTALLFAAGRASADPGTAYTWQGRLAIGSTAVSGTVDVRFALYDMPTSGTQVGAPIQVTRTLQEGIIQESLDFGGAAFTGDPRFLEIEVANPSGGAFVTLTPRIEVKPVPYAIFAATAGNGSGGTLDGHSLDSSDGSMTDVVFVDSAGRVQIGDSGNSPQNKFRVTTSGSDGGITIQTDNNALSNGLNFQNSGDFFSWSIQREDAGSNNSDLVIRGGNIGPTVAGLGERMRFDSGGQISIGGANPPEGALDVTGRMLSDALTVGAAASTYPVHLNTAGTPEDSYAGATPSQQARIQMFVNETDETGGGLAISNEGGFFDLNDGFVTYLPLTDGEGLRVHGRLNVVTNAWPDFVFDEGYDLKSIEEVEAHIREHGHLPGVPPAAEVEARGNDLGEMDKILLQQIEEMTLRQIEMKKENDELRRIIDHLRSEMGELRETLSRPTASN